MKPFPMTDQDGWTIIHLPAELEQNDWLGFRDHIQSQCIDQGRIRLVIDCEASPDLPSIAFGTFTSLFRDLHRAGGSLHLIHVSEKIRKVLTRTRLNDYIPVRGTLTEVIRR